MAIHALDSSDHLPGTNATLIGTEGGVIVQKPFSTTATANNIVQRDANGDVIVPAVPSSSTAAASKGYVDGLGTPLWGFVEENVVGSAVTTFDFAATLDGDNESAYYLCGKLVNSTGSSVSYRLRLNTAIAVGNYQDIFAAGTSITGARTTAANLLFAFTTTATTTSFELVLPAVVTGNARHFFSKCTRGTGAGLSFQMFCAEITTPSTATNITSIGVDASVASGIGIGSHIMLAKRAV